MIYETKDFAHLIGMDGFSGELLNDHFTLYKGYVANTNKNLELLTKLTSGSYEAAEVRRRLGWEFNGMRLHEYYFGNLGGNGKLKSDSRLMKFIKDSFGGFENWEKDFRAAAAMRGIGWVVLYHDTMAKKLINFWINEHDVAHPAGCQPILVMDVFEHAFIRDYGLARGGYIDAFFKNIDWAAAEERL
ncbi:MAG: superoxide dismutase [Calditrichaceae bacterium]